MLVLYRTPNSSLSAVWTADSSLISGEGDDNVQSNDDRDRGNIRGRIEDAYHDEPPPGIEEQAPISQPEERGSNGSDGRGLVVQPSRLQSEGNEWRED